MIALRFHPRCWHRDEGKIRSIPRPALIATVTDGAGGLQGVHRTWLALYGKGKARVETQRRAMGQLLGNAVRLTRYEDILVGDEGIETMLSLVAAMPGLAAWVALSSGYLGAVLLPQGCRGAAPKFGRADRASGSTTHLRLSCIAQEAVGDSEAEITDPCRGCGSSLSSPPGTSHPAVIRATSKRWAGGLQRCRPFRDGGD